MKILVLNQDWFANEWRASGHEVVTCGMGNHLDCPVESTMVHIDSLTNIAGWSVPDVIVYHDNSSPIYYTGLEDTDVPSVFFSVDTQHHAELHRFLFDIFDYTYVAQKDYIPYFEAEGKHPEWLPLWAPRQVEPSKEKRYGAVFVGSLDEKLNPERVAFFRALESKIPIVCTSGEYWKIFPHAELVINQTVKGDLNFRVFETQMCGAMLLTERSGNGLCDLFTPDKQLALYEKNNIEDASQKISYYLNNISEAREIAAAGRERILMEHLPHHRANVMLERLKVVTKSQSTRKYLSAMANFTILAIRKEKNKIVGSETAYINALRCFSKAIDNKEPLGSEHAYMAIVAIASFERLIGGGAGEELLMQASDAYPDNLVLQYGSIRVYLNRGDISLATSKARSIDPREPCEVFAAAEHAVTTMLATELV